MIFSKKTHDENVPLHVFLSDLFLNFTLQADDMVAALGVLAQGETNAALIESMDPWMATDLNEETKNCVVSLFLVS